MKSIRFTLTFFLLIISFNSNALYKLKDSYLGGVYESPAAFVAKYQGKCTYVNYRQGHWSKTFEANEYRAYVLEPTYSDASCTKVYDSGGYASRYKNWVSTTFNCPDGQELNPATNACETPQQQCEEIPLGSRSWTYSIYGDSPSICMNGCSVGLKGMAVCTTSGNSCSGDLAQDGSTCSSGDGMKPGGDMPEVPPGECQWQGESGNQTLVCKGDSDGDGKPDDGAPPDEDGSCEWDGNTLTCTGGTFDPSNPDNPSNPNNPDNGGDTGPVVVNPPTGGGDGVDLPVENTADILTAIKNFNSDNNKNAKDINGNLSDIEKILMLDADSNKDLLHEINTDNNKGFENVVGAIKNIEGYDPTTTDGILNEI
ncbi:MAG: hypothetical protein JKY55_05985 [Aliivibrio sp.]|uniref:hypothetical protein n=1 Tax=Aliivibrio sp. TaxID=1872443 RepID=UPI001A5A673E|nr:hypothetical protein [Aliivibrio sp.]